jgi:phosphoribosylanthranilate isomerase
VFVQICGITSEEDALLAVAMGADAVGFVFAPSSRQMQPVQAYDIVRRLPPDVLTVGVFRDELPQRVVDIVHQVGLKAAQLHGHESPADTAFVRERVGWVLKAFPAGSSALDRVHEYRADAVLIDSATPGSGQVFDWALADGAPLDRRVVLAGGLNPDNVADAIHRVQPWGVDVSTGVERSPGRKDPRKVKDFIERARAAAPVPYEGDAHAPYDWQEDDF